MSTLGERIRRKQNLLSEIESHKDYLHVKTMYKEGILPLSFKDYGEFPEIPQDIESQRLYLLFDFLLIYQ